MITFHHPIQPLLVHNDYFTTWGLCNMTMTAPIIRITWANGDESAIFLSVAHIGFIRAAPASAAIPSFGRTPAVSTTTL